MRAADRACDLHDWLLLEVVDNLTPESGSSGTGPRRSEDGARRAPHPRQVHHRGRPGAPRVNHHLLVIVALPQLVHDYGRRSAEVVGGGDLVVAGSAGGLGCRPAEVARAAGNGLIFGDEARAEDDIAAGLVEDLEAGPSVRGPWFLELLLVDLGRWADDRVADKELVRLMLPIVDQLSVLRDLLEGATILGHYGLLDVGPRREVPRRLADDTHVRVHRSHLLMPMTYPKLQTHPRSPGTQPLPTHELIRLQVHTLRLHWRSMTAYPQLYRGHSRHLQLFVLHKRWTSIQL